MQNENPIEHGTAVEPSPEAHAAPAKTKRRSAHPPKSPRATASAAPPETAADGACAKPAKSPARKAVTKKRATRAKQAATEGPATEGAPPKRAKKAHAKAAGTEKAGPRRAKAAAKGGPTLTDVAAGFLAHLEAEGCSMGTVAGYRGELVIAAGFLGGDTPVADLTPERVADYFTCDRVTKTRAGEPKNQRTIDKSRRVLRLALVWAAEQGLIAEAPIPEAL